MATNIVNYDVRVKNSTKIVTQFNTINTTINQTVVAADKLNKSIKQTKSDKLVGVCKKYVELGNAISSVTKVGYEFQSKMADLSAATGSSEEKIKKLSVSSQLLGVTSGLGASKIAESYTTIANCIDTSKMSVKELDEIQKKSIVLSQASGLSLNQCSSSLASNLKSFGVAASESNRFINVLAAGAKASKLDVNVLSDSLSAVGSVANKLGVNVESASGAVGVLNGMNLKGAKAGDELGAILSTMSDKLGTDFSNVSMADALDSLGPKVNDISYLTSVFGEEHAKTAQYLIQNSQAVDELTNKVTQSSVATDQAAIKTQTWAHRQEIFQAGIDGVKTVLTNLTGGCGAFANMIAQTAGEVENVISIVSGVKDVFGTVKSFFSSFGKSSDDVNKNKLSVKSYSKEMKKLSKSVGGNQRKFGSLMTKMKGFGKGLKAKSLGRITKKMKSMRKAIVGIAKAQKLKQLWDGIAAAKAKVMAVSQMVMNASMWACPVTWIVVGIIALVAVIYLLMTKVSGLSTLWSAAVNFMKHCFLGYICVIKLGFVTFLNGFMMGIDKLRIGWIKFKMAMGWGNQEENEKSLADLEANIEKRKKCIKEAANDVNEHAKAAYDSKNMVHLGWKKDESEEKEGSKVTSNGSEADTQTESISNQTIQTSSQKIVSGGNDDKKKQININLNSLVDKIIFNGTLEEKAQDLEEQVTRIIHRVLLEANRI
ncbi:phage tail tape measure protein [Gammaproteobacteria bacterium]|nr:phage tail tape measure protein [Gammaproteobacteria bacterium]